MRVTQNERPCGVLHIKEVNDENDPFVGNVTEGEKDGRMAKLKRHFLRKMAEAEARHGNELLVISKVPFPSQSNISNKSPSLPKSTRDNWLIRTCTSNISSKYSNLLHFKPLNQQPISLLSIPNIPECHTTRKFRVALTSNFSHAPSKNSSPSMDGYWPKKRPPSPHTVKTTLKIAKTPRNTN